MADTEQQAEIDSVADLLNEIENENLYRALLTVDKRTLQIVLLKMQGYSTKEIAPIVHLTTGAIYARLDHKTTAIQEVNRKPHFPMGYWVRGQKPLTQFL